MPASTVRPDTDERLALALEQLAAAITANTRRNAEILTSIGIIRDAVDRGLAPTDALDAEPRPRIVELLTSNIDTLHSAGATFRAALAQALHDDGMTIATIADEFGVTRQRVSALLKQHHATIDL